LNQVIPLLLTDARFLTRPFGNRNRPYTIGVTDQGPKRVHKELPGPVDLPAATKIQDFRVARALPRRNRLSLMGRSDPVHGSQH